MGGRERVVINRGNKLHVADPKIPFHSLLCIFLYLKFWVFFVFKNDLTVDISFKHFHMYFCLIITSTVYVMFRYINQVCSYFKNLARCLSSNNLEEKCRPNNYQQNKTWWMWSCSDNPRELGAHSLATGTSDLGGTSQASNISKCVAYL